MGILAVVVSIIAIGAGASNLSFFSVVQTLLGHGTKQAKIIIFDIRLPRIIAACVAGIGLAVSGCVMQSILKNPLASASTLGVSQGAAFGAAFAIIVLGAGMTDQAADSVAIANPYLVTCCAFISSMLSTFVVLGLSRFRHITPETMILSGVALSALFSGGTTLLQYFSSDVKLASVVFWTFGDLGRASWKEIAVMSVVTSALLLYALYNRWNYNALLSGEQSAKSLGVSVDVLRMVGMVLCSLAAATIVSFVGIINFIGLIAPHLMRRLVGSDYRFLLPTSALCGALLMLLSDTAARMIISPIILPIGAITSFLGAPLFLYLLVKGADRC
ncbi:MAG: iron ABC transporter permease [Spirochaetia bacterium]|nr:iron ABC transporter permease [Spirochaetia bacterium]